MSVVERYKQRSASKKSDGIPLSPIETNIYQPSSIESSSLLDRSVQADEVTPVTQLSFAGDPINSISGESFTTPGAPEGSTALMTQDMLGGQVALAEQTEARSLRVPTRIRGTGKKSAGTMLAPKITGKRTLTHAVMIALTFLVVVGVLATVLPLTSDGQAQGGNSLIKALMHWIPGKGENTAQISSQIATATAVTRDGFDAGNQTFAGVVNSNGSANASDAGSLNRFFYGQCTYWANMRYHQLTGRWVPWLGNAYEWAYQASAYGWVVSSTPHVPSIMVFQPYVQGAGAFGHVAIVESINGNDITTSNWNAAGGGWATTSYLINHPGPGVSFVSYPGA